MASCAILVPEGVTRWSKRRAAISRWSRRQRLDGAFEVIGDDLPRASERVERLRPQRGRACAPLDVPEALHDELEIWRLDPTRRPVLLDDPHPTGSELDAARTDAVQDAIDERVLRDDGLPLELAPASRGRTMAARPATRSSLSRRRTLAKRVRDVGLEPIEQRERVLAQRAGAHSPGEGG